MKKIYYLIFGLIVPGLSGVCLADLGYDIFTAIFWVFGVIAVAISLGISQILSDLHDIKKQLCLD